MTGCSLTNRIKGPLLNERKFIEIALAIKLLFTLRDCAIVVFAQSWTRFRAVDGGPGIPEISGCSLS